jgi:hypothetical protein
MSAITISMGDKVRRWRRGAVRMLLVPPTVLFVVFLVVPLLLLFR